MIRTKPARPVRVRVIALSVALALPSLVSAGAAGAAASASASLPASDAAGDTPWKLVFSDDFERAELGDEWIATDARIVAGELLLGRRGPACAKLARSYPADVRLEFVARAFEERPPCDLSVTLAAERFRLMSWNYLLAFGGMNNTVNKLTGGRRMPAVRDESPDRLIEPGRTYRITATKEGREITMEVDGSPLLGSTDADVMGGPGFDAVGLVTWGGMYVDRVRIYERSPAHPETPRYVTRLEPMLLTVDETGHLVAKDGAIEETAGLDEAIAAFDRGDLADAAERFDALDGEARAAGLAWTYGRLEHDERADDFERVARLWADLARAHPDDERIESHAWAAALFGRVRIFPRSEKECGLLLALGPRDNPYYDKAKLYRARFLRARGQEGADGSTLSLAQSMFAELREKSPEHAILRQLTGDSIPWGAELISRDPDAPRWAALLRELYARQLTILEWWFTDRQLPDGQLGGGWGDDVEILRSWAPLAVISTAHPAIRDGIERLADGVWRHVLEDGFDRTLGDVEHSAEPSADTIPSMLALRHGDPLWYERNLASCRRIRDIYTGIDQRGYRRFKSGYIGGDGVSPHPEHGGDTYYSARAMKHLLWAALAGDAAAREVYLDWVRGWVDATLRADGSKPAGVPPGTIWYPSGEIAPPNGAAWNDPAWNLYGCCHIGNFWIQDTFLAGYALSGEPLFLRPIHAWMRYYESAPPAGSDPDATIETDPLAWAIRNAKDTWQVGPTLAEYRWLTGDPSFDALYGPEREAGRLHMPRTLEALERRLERALRGLRVNFDLHTREVLQTDRAGLAGTETTFTTYTGAVRLWGDAGLPTMAVTWEAPHADFAAIVPRATPEHLRAWLYTFSATPTHIGMRLWQLVPGEYDVAVGSLAEGEGFDRRCRWTRAERVTVRHRADVYSLDVPPGREVVVDFRLVEAHPLPALLADPAIGARDVRATRSRPDRAVDVDVTVHNLGGAEVSSLDVALVRVVSGTDAATSRETLATRSVRLPASADLEPAAATVSFADVRIDGAETGDATLEVLVDPDDTVREANELNNAASVPLESAER